MQAFCGRRLWSLTCAATRLCSCPALTVSRFFFLPNSKGLNFFPPIQAGGSKSKQKWGGEDGRKIECGYCIPFPSQEPIGHMCSQAANYKGFYHGLLLSVSTVLREGTVQLETGEYGSQMASSSMVCAYSGSAESGACFSHLLCCSAGPFCSGRSTPCKCCNTLMEHPWYILDAQPHFTYLHFCKFNVAFFFNCFTFNFCNIMSLKIKLLQISKNRGIKKKWFSYLFYFF